MVNGYIQYSWPLEEIKDWDIPITYSNKDC